MCRRCLKPRKWSPVTETVRPLPLLMGITDVVAGPDTASHHVTIMSLITTLEISWACEQMRAALGLPLVMPCRGELVAALGLAQAAPQVWNTRVQPVLLLCFPLIPCSLVYHSLPFFLDRMERWRGRLVSSAWIKRPRLCHEDVYLIVMLIHES